MCMNFKYLELSETSGNYVYMTEKAINSSKCAKNIFLDVQVSSVKFSNLLPKLNVD